MILYAAKCGDVMDDNSLFKYALLNKKLDLLKQVHKTDLHNHSSRGANRKYFEEKYNIKFPDVPTFKNIEDMNNWYNENIDKYTSGFEGFKDRIISMFIEVNSENVLFFSPMFCLSMKKYFDNSVEKYIEFIIEMKNKYAPNTVLLPELSLSRNEEINIKDIYEALSFDFFKSVDLMGDEKLGVDKFIPIYKICDKHGLILKAHVGEFTSYEYVDEAIDKLNLDAINHGLSIIQSKKLMDKISKLKLLVNISPSSNYHLSRCDYKNHPIKLMYDNDILLTINTDDLIIFNKSLSEEYLNLYNNGTLNVSELNEIRNNGLTYCLSKRS